MSQIIYKVEPISIAEPLQSTLNPVPAILVWQSAEQLQRIEDKLDQLLAALYHKDMSK